MRCYVDVSLCFVWFHMRLSCCTVVDAVCICVEEGKIVLFKRTTVVLQESRFWLEHCLNIRAFRAFPYSVSRWAPYGSLPRGPQKAQQWHRTWGRQLSIMVIFRNPFESQLSPLFGPFQLVHRKTRSWIIGTVSLIASRAACCVQ